MKDVLSSVESEQVYYLATVAIWRPPCCIHEGEVSLSLYAS